jgi:hypothetical protein
LKKIYGDEDTFIDKKATDKASIRFSKHQNSNSLYLRLGGKIDKQIYLHQIISHDSPPLYANKSTGYRIEISPVF